MKSLSKLLFVVYLLTLLWLVLFKFSFDILTVIVEHQSRSLNLIPFAGSSQGNIREMIDNFMIFIPFGLLLGVNMKKMTFWRKLAIIFISSFAVETLQFIFAIGITDITDIITNTLGGLVGLLIYDLCKKYVNNKRLDQFITILGAVLIVLLLLLRFFVFRVKY